MPATITIQVRAHYGTSHRYVLDSDQAKALQKLTGTRTLTEAHITALRTLGFSIEYVIGKEGQV